MAISYSQVQGAAAVVGINPGTLIAAFEDGSGRSRSFQPVNTPSGGTAASAVYPSLTSVSAVTANDECGTQGLMEDESSSSVYGAVTLVLKAGTADTISSPGMVFVLDQDVSVITVSGTF